MRTSLASALTLLLFGCGDDDTDTPVDAGTDTSLDAGDELDAGEDAGATDVFVRGDAGPTVVYTVEVSDLLTGDPITVARLCVFEVPALPCVMTNEMGVAEIELPIEADVAIQTTALRYFPQLNPLRTGDADGTFDIEIGKTSNIEPLIATLGVDLDATKGQLAWLAQSSPGEGVEGVTAALDPSSGDGPYFVDNGSLPDPTLTATSEAGLGVFANVDPGEVTVTYASPTGSCAVRDAWDGGGENRARVPIAAAHLTITINTCPPPAMDAGPPDAGADDAGADDAGADAGVDAEAPDAGA